jgi:hypothetical protein
MLGRLWELCSGAGCSLALSAEYRRLWDGLPTRALCMHLGQETGERRPCTSCRGRVELKVFVCFHPAHQTTSLDQCHHCPDFEA